MACNCFETAEDDVVVHFELALKIYKINNNKLAGQFHSAVICKCELKKLKCLKPKAKYVWNIA